MTHRAINLSFPQSESQFGIRRRTPSPTIISLSLDGLYAAIAPIINRWTPVQIST